MWWNAKYVLWACSFPPVILPLQISWKSIDSLSFMFFATKDALQLFNIRLQVLIKSANHAQCNKYYEFHSFLKINLLPHQVKNMTILHRWDDISWRIRITFNHSKEHNEILLSCEYLTGNWMPINRRRQLDVIYVQ